MPLQKQLVAITAPQGIQTKVDSKLLQMGQALELDNVRIDKQGTISKRMGFNNLPSFPVGLTPNRLFSFQDTTILSTTNNGSELKAFFPGTNDWRTVGYVSGWSQTLKSLTASTEEHIMPSMVETANLVVYTYQRYLNNTDQGAQLVVEDKTTGRRILDQNISSTARRAKMVVIGSLIYIVYAESTVLKSKVINTATLTIGSATTIINTLSAAQQFDLGISLLKPVVVYSSSTPSIECAYLTAAGGLETSPTPLSVTATNGDEAVNLEVLPGGNLLLAWANSSHQTFYQVVEPSYFGAVVAKTSILAASNVVGNITSLNGQLLLSERAALVNYQPINHLVRVFTVGVASASVTTGTVLRGVFLGSKLFSDTHVIIGYESKLQPTNFIYNVLTNQVCGKIAALTAGGVPGARGLAGYSSYSAETGFLPSVTTELRFPCVTKGVVQSEAGVVFSLRNLSLAQLVKNPTINAAEFNSLFFAGSLPCSFDGVRAVESGFCLFPEEVTTTPGGAGSAPVGLYSLAVTYAWEDALGQRFESAPWYGSATIAGTQSTIALTIPSLRVTNKPDNVEIVVYRSVANGTILYRETSVVQPTLNIKSADTVSYTITIPATDTVITTTPLLYTVGGVIDNDGHPSCDSVVVYRGRLFFSGLEDKKTIAYSKILRPGQAVECSAQYIINVPAGEEPIAYSAVMDDKLILFKANSLYALAGDGPSDTGLGNDYSNPIAIASDVGSSNQRSCVITPLGLIFKSRKGLYLLDRGMNVSYIGAPAEEYNYLEPTSAILLPSVNEIRWTTADKTIVYNYFFKAWFTHTGTPTISAALVSQRMYLIGTDNSLKVESLIDNTDTGAWVQTSLTTGWISPTLQGFERVYRLLFIGSLASASQLTVEVGYDFEDFFSETFTFSTETLFPLTAFGDTSPFGLGVYGGSFNGVPQWMIMPSRQKCQALRIRFTDSSPSGVGGEGFSLTGITAQVGQKAGTNKLPAAKRVTGSGRV